jgi:hypothetical protein
MPVLKNIRQEAFCQHIAKSPKTRWPQGRCYTEAGYKATDRVADACAARMLTYENIQRRIAELVEPAVRKTKTTVDTLAMQLDEVFEGATGDRQWGAAGSAAAIKAKLLGFMRDKLEVGAVGQFDDCDSPQAVIDKLIDDLGDPREAVPSLREFADAIELRLGDQATIIEQAPQWQRPSEVDQALALLRPARKRH